MVERYVCGSLQADEADRLCQACESLEEKLIVWTLLDTGMRVSELCNLKAEQILPQKKAIRISSTKSEERDVPMSKRVQTLLKHYFAINNHWPVGPRQTQKIVKQVANKAKLSQTVTPHVLRYTFETIALQKGISPATVKEILGTNRLSRGNIAERVASLRSSYNSTKEILKHMTLQDLGIMN